MPTYPVTETGSQLPLCPLTQRPVKRRVHGFATKALLRAWRLAGAGDLAHLFGTRQQVVLYESATGLFFFEPMAAGDKAFYSKFYHRIGAHTRLNARMQSRVEFRRAAAHVPVGAAVLDVGCRMGAFVAHVGHASYVGIDPFAPDDAPAQVLRETLEAHAQRRQASYDVVTAFQVIEHTRDPQRFAQQCVELLRPGGMLILCAPLHPSPLTEIPNLLLNFPPHHLSWWNRSAFTALAQHLALEPVEIAELPFSPHQASIGWLNRCSFARTPTAPNERYFAHRWAWHANLFWAYWAARVADHYLPPPSSIRPIDVFMAARKRA